MTALRPDLLLADYRGSSNGSKFGATTSAHGLYNTQQFVLRLSPLVHQRLASVVPGIGVQFDFEIRQAMSTYLHETIHWWQHIGSTYGFILGLNYPVQTHCTHHDLLRLVQFDGFKKSVLLQSSELGKAGSTGYGTPAGTANIVVNNHFDLFAYRAITLGPETARLVIQNNLFESIGHSFHLTYSHTINTLASTVDPEFKVLPHPREWENAFRDLRSRKVQGYYYGSPVGLYPIGAYEIFEGQASFSQMQFISRTCAHPPSWDDFKAIGMLHGVYILAFDAFLKWTESAWPSNTDSPLVSLFLLVCDLSINPGSGFPFSIFPNFESFIDDVNPGSRFILFCRLIANRFPHFKKTIIRHDRTEYEEISSQLCHAAKEVDPLKIATKFSGWFNAAGPFSSLLEQYNKYEFDPRNFVIGHLFAHFLAFQADKAKRPEFFCWPATHMVGKDISIENQRLFERHSALFVDKEDNDSIFPRIQNNRDACSVKKTFDDFYRAAALFDLTHQWIAQKGPFQYNMEWLIASASKDEMRRWLRGQFINAVGLDPETAILL